MILAITAVHLTDIAMVALVLVGLGWIFHLGRRLIDLVIDRMSQWAKRDLAHHAEEAARLAKSGKEDSRYYPTDAPVVLPDATQYPVQAGSLEGTPAELHPKHAAPVTEQETTLLIPKVTVPPVDDPAALRIVESLTSGGER